MVLAKISESKSLHSAFGSPGYRYLSSRMTTWDEETNIFPGSVSLRYCPDHPGVRTATSTVC